MSHSRQTHWIVAKHVLRYLQGKVGHGLRYTSSISMMLQGYTNFDWERSAVERKITFECFFTLGSTMVSWCSKKHTSVVLSTAEVEYIALSVEVCEAVWLRKLLADLFRHVLDSIVIHVDNQSCLKLSENPLFHDKSKHIDIKYHYIREMMQRKVVLVQYLPTDEQVIDVLMKPLTRMKFEYFRDRLGVVENASLV
jgi:hypothetical protein